MQSKPKKIGTLTLPLHSNYGGLLQAYALQRYLKERGHEVLVIDRQFNKKFTGPLVQLLKKTVFPSKWKHEQEQKAIRANTDYFISKYIEPKTKPYFSSEGMEAVVSGYNLDALVVGSDQVWRVDYTNAMAKDFFYAFAKNTTVQRLSYAASFGKGEWEQPAELTGEIKNLIQKFDGVSVREDSGVEICSKYFDKEAVRHVDPTMLLKVEDYEHLAKAESEPAKDGNILVYMLDIKEDRQKVIDEVVQHVGGKTYSINKPVIKPGMTLEAKKYPTVTSWLRGFMDAEYVVTDSFHGTIFSLLFNKPFIVYGNKERGLTRFYSMLKTVGLEHRIILSSEELTQDLLQAEIDWTRVNTELKKQRGRTDEYFSKLGI